VHDIYNGNAIGKIIYYAEISIKMKEMEFVAKGEDVNDHISNNLNITEIKLDPLDDNIPIPYEVFYEFINKRLETIFLFRKNAFLDDMAKKRLRFLLIP
jgi:predicted DNA-binding protein (UPF0278 family)